jgi:hypothetical protein
MRFRNLRADEIDCRVSTVSEKGCSILLYKDARCDMRILDETVGAENWQRSHEVINNNLFCNVAIHIPKSETRDFAEWVVKQDVGTESYTEKEKGEASDSFKRACFNWGIGRELYTAPFIWVTSNKCNIKPKNNGFTTYDKFKCTHIEIQNGIITELKIHNLTTKKEVFSFGRAPESKVVCESCGNDLEPIIKRDGELWQVSDIQAYSLRRFNKCLCANCQKDEMKTQSKKEDKISKGVADETV